MATEKRLIGNTYKCDNCIHVQACQRMCAIFAYDFLDCAMRSADCKTHEPKTDAVEVVFCDNCVNHGNCFPETAFRIANIEKPYCCVGKMDGDGNG